MREIMEWVNNEVIMRKHGYDGRQIRNIISCAMTVARAKGRKLSKEEVLDVVGYVRDFKSEFQIQFDRYLRSQDGTDGAMN
jgi:sulfur relay (sulfurtransferase) DsrC/TusE family protein